MPKFFSPEGNPEVWDTRPAGGYLTPAEWAAAHPAPEPPAPTLEEAKAAKLAEIESRTSATILAGFDFTLNGESLHFSYERDDQQNFADSANVAMLTQSGADGFPTTVTWNAYRNWSLETGGELVRLTLTAAQFLELYTAGALAHKAATMEVGWLRKAVVAAATSVEDVEAA